MIKVKELFKYKAFQVIYLIGGASLFWFIVSIFDKTCEEEIESRVLPIEIRSIVKGKFHSHAREGLIIDLKDGRYIDICWCVGNLYDAVEPGDSIFKKANSLVFTIARGDSVFEVDITCPK